MADSCLKAGPHVGSVVHFDKPNMNSQSKESYLRYWVRLTSFLHHKLWFSPQLGSVGGSLLSVIWKSMTAFFFTNVLCRCAVRTIVSCLHCWKAAMKEDPAWHATVSCPWTWGEDGRPYVPMPLSSASTVADELDASPTSWHRVVDMVSHYKNPLASRKTKQRFQCQFYVNTR